MDATTPALDPAPALPDAPGLAAKVLRVAWLAIALGFVIEALVLAIALAYGTASGPKPFLADLVGKVAWSTVVCVGLVFGRAASKALPAAMGAAGLVAAPLAFNLARALHKGASQALGMVAAGAAGPSPLTVSLIKAAAYAVLGLALGWIATRPWGGASAHAVAGLLVGLLFGGGLIAMTLAAVPDLPTSTLLARSVNEVLFPVGCALAIFAAESLGKRIA